MKKLLLILPLIPKLGFWNVAYAAWYKLSMKLGWRKWLFPLGGSVEGRFFKETNKALDYPKDWEEKLFLATEQIYNGTFTWFSYHKFEVGPIPNWFYNPFENKVHSQIYKHWTEISDFGEGDIKIFWELSRFDWLTTLARAYKVSDNVKYLNRLNELLNDWSKHNPLNQGPNWKCGQEASFRLMKLLTTAFLLDQFNCPSENLKKLIYQHVRRIEGNIMYGIVQNNNHGSSEAIGLYIGSVWLARQGNKSAYLTNWRNKGRRLLEGRILKLIQEQGSFSQRSMTYHRVMVDTMSFCLQMMELLNEKAFSDQINRKLIALGDWQYKMTFGQDGDAPNYGSNDGARIENLCNNDYRDFRPSTQMFFGLLTKERIYENLNVSEAMFWRCGKNSLTFALRKIDLQKGEILDNHNLILRNDRAKVFMKLPDDTFRPGNDAFHVDLWINGEPVLVDAGTYSYNADELTDRYKSVAAHNTIQFGNEEQMPKIGRFLNGQWISLLSSKPIEFSNDKIMWSGTYKDFRQNTHSRKLTLSPTTLLIEDTVISSFDVHSRYHFSKDKYSNQSYQGIKSEASLYYLEQHETILYEDVRKNNDLKKREISLNYKISLV